MVQADRTMTRGIPQAYSEYTQNEHDDELDPEELEECDTYWQLIELYRVKNVS